MSKKKEVLVDEVEEAQENEPAHIPTVMNKRAYSVMEKGGEFHLVCVTFNSDTLEVGSATVLKSDPDRFNIEYDFEQATEEMIYD